MSDSTPTGLLVLHGNRAELLMQTVTAWLAAHPLAPLEEDVVLVQSNGMAEWLKMTLAQQAGICAATRVELPARFQWRLYRQTLGRRQVPTHSPLDKTPLTWRLMAQLPGLLTQPEFAPVAGFLQGEEPERPLQLARRLADLFDQYQIYRADWLDDWAAGHDVLRRATGEAPAVPPDQAWQPALWRALLAPLDEAGHAALRPALQRRVVAALRSDQPTAQALPRRVVLFGMTHLPLATLELLAALGTRCQVMLAIPNPCRFHWADTIDGRELLRWHARRQPLKGGHDLSGVPLEALHAHAHPLLAAWGRQSRDFIRQLDQHDDSQRAAEQAELPRIDLFDEAADPPQPSLLLQVQQRIRDLVPLAEHEALRQPVPESDRSIVFHLAHSAMREVEVLHDQLLQQLAQAEPTAEGRPLAPRDIVVMVPDIASFEPAIRAVFGQYSRHDPRHIPYDIADLSARSASPLIGALEWLLRLPQQRCTFSELRDLMDVPALARRFGLAAEQLPQLAQWMAGAGLRWGLGPDQRSALGLAACGEVNSALWAVQRLLLGFASGAGELDTGRDASSAADAAPVFDGIEPHAEVAGLEAGLAGALATLVERLAHWWTQLRQPATPADWATQARALLADFFTATDDAERAALAALDEALTTWQDACEQASFAAEVPLAVAREAWLGALDEPALNKRFRAGGVTFCTLMPMRAIPFEVVCLLGMNEGDYPRRAPRSDFDLMGQAGQTRPGDRARRDDDRQLMLEALLSARRTLHISWTGRNVRDNAEQPPSVLVAQLRDYLAAGWGPQVLEQRSTVHPLQPFSRRYFEPQPGVAYPLFTYAREWRQAHLGQPSDGPLATGPGGAGQGAGVGTGDGAFERADALTLPPFSPDPQVPLTLERLTRFLRNPVRAYFAERLRVQFDEVQAEDLDDETFAVAGLQAHGLLTQVLQATLGELAAGRRAPEAAADPGTDVDVDALLHQQLQRLRRSGQLPLGALGARAQADLQQSLGAALRTWQAQMARFCHAVPHQPLAWTHDSTLGPLRLEDWLDGLRSEAWADDTPTPVQWHLLASQLTQPGKKKGDPPRPRIERLIGPWLVGLASAACGQPVRVGLVGRDALLLCHPPAPETAQALLGELLEAWLAGQCQPLPVALRSALAWLAPAADGGPKNPAQAEADAASAYEGGFMGVADVSDPCLRRLWPDAASLLEADGGAFTTWAEQLYAELATWAADPQQVQIQLHVV